MSVAPGGRAEHLCILMIQLDLHFDYIDPASFVMKRRIRDVVRALGLTVSLIPWELRLPGEAPILADDPLWVAWWDTLAPAAAEAGLVLRQLGRVPATRKAHELVMHASAAGEGDGGSADSLHEAIFRAALAESVDIARVDVLVGLAVELGMDRSETRAVLDVDRYSSDVDRCRQGAIDRGVTGAPTLVIGESRMEGVHDAATIREFVTGSMDMEG